MFKKPILYKSFSCTFAAVFKIPTNKIIKTMKKFFLGLAISVISISANAQVYVGGGLGFSSVKAAHHEDVDVDTKTTFSLVPEIGYQLDEKLAVGIGLGYSHSKDGDEKGDAFSIEPYARYTFAKLGTVDLFIEGGVGYQHTKNAEEISDNVEVNKKENTFYIGVRPGFKVNLNQKIALVSRVGWLGWKTTKPDVDDYKGSSEFGLNLDATAIQFGVNYTF